MMTTRFVLENVATMLATAAIVLGLWWMGAEGWSFLGFVLLLNMNYPRRSANRDSENG